LAKAFAQYEYEPFAWWLTRERIGQDLRERYGVAQELPPRLLGACQETRTSRRQSFPSALIVTQAIIAQI
jgi:hypothetical protein